MLACTRIGAAHSVIFGGFSPESVRDRIHDADSKLVITADGGWRRGTIVPLKKNTDEALKECPDVGTVIVLKRTGQPIDMQAGRDIWWDDFVKGVEPKCPAEPMDAEDLLYLLYTSGLDRQAQGHHPHDRRLPHRRRRHPQVGLRPPRGRRLLVHGRRRLGDRSLLRRLRAAGQRRHHGDVRGHAGLPRQGPVLADHREARHHDLLHRAHRDPHLHAVGRGVSRSAATSRACGCSARVGEPINPEAWVWYWKVIGGGRCPVVDTWWQTETGHILITPLPGVTVLKPGSATKPFPGIDAEVLDEQGKAGQVRLPGDPQAVAGHAARHLGRPRPLREAVLVEVRRHLLHRRRRQARRGRLLLAPRSRRRRDERLRSPGLHHGGRVGAGRPQVGRRGGRHRQAARDQGAGDRGVRHHQDRASTARRR